MGYKAVTVFWDTVEIDGRRYKLGEDYWRFMVPKKSMANSRREAGVSKFRTIIKPATITIPGLGKPG